MELDGEEVGIDGWNEPEDAYAFVYTKTDDGSKNIVLVKCLPIGDLLAVDVLDLNEQQKEPLNIQIKYASLPAETLVFFLNIEIFRLPFSLA